MNLTVTQVIEVAKKEQAMYEAVNAVLSCMDQQFNKLQEPQRTEAVRLLTAQLLAINPMYIQKQE